MIAFADNANIGWLLVLIGLLCWIGDAMVGRDWWRRAWGRRIATGVLLAYCGQAIVRNGLSGASDAVHIVMHGLLAYGLSLGMAWMFVAIHRFVQEDVVGAWKEHQRRRTEREREREAWRAFERTEAERRSRPTPAIVEPQQKTVADKIADIHRERDRLKGCADDILVDNWVSRRIDELLSE